DKRILSTVAHQVERLGEELFSDSGLACDEHWDSARCDALNRGDRFANIGARRDDSKAQRTAIQALDSLEHADSRFLCVGFRLNFETEEPLDCFSLVRETEALVHASCFPESPAP